VQKKRNWLLAEEDTEQNDPYGIPREEDKIPGFDTLQTPGPFDDRSQYGSPERESSWFKPRDDAAADPSKGDRFNLFNKEMIDPRDPRKQSPQNYWSGSPLQEGRKVGTGWLQSKTPESPARPASPFSGLGTPPKDKPSTSHDRPQGYTPYKSPYQIQSDRRTQPMAPRQGPTSGFKRTDPYQAWKDKNPNRTDPVRDDAYVDELMPKFKK